MPWRRIVPVLFLPDVLAGKPRFYVATPRDTQEQVFNFLGLRSHVIEVGHDVTVDHIAP